jgi:hypothetical protein
MKAIDLTKCNAVAKANEGAEMELFFAGESTGVFLNVLGTHADAVRKNRTESLKDYARKQAMAEKRGDTVEFHIRLLEQSEEKSIDNALVRVTGWRGQPGEYSKEVMRSVLEKNPDWVNEIMEFSDFLGKSNPSKPIA